MRSTLALLAFLFLSAAPAKATLSLTLDITDGSWSAEISQSLNVAALIGYRSLWIDTALTGNSISTSTASMTYSGVYGGNAVSGTGSAIISSIDGISNLGQVRDVSFRFLTGLSGGANSFSSLTITPTSPFNNAANYQTFASDTVPALNNLPIEVIIVPEPGSLVLGFLALAAGLVVRLRKQRR